MIQQHSFPGQSPAIAHIMVIVAVAVDGLVLEPNLQKITENLK